MLLCVAHVAVAGEQPVDDYAVILAVYTGAACNRIGKLERTGYILQAGIMKFMGGKFGQCWSAGPD